MQRILIAPDKFKGSLSAAEVAEALAAGLRRADPEVAVRIAPVADGGDGTVAAALARGYRALPVRVSGPVGGLVDTTIAVDGTAAVVELASASGLTLLDELAPLTASSLGTGELIRAALDAGARTIVLGIGGSACTDGGAGMLTGLGTVLRDSKGAVLPPGGSALAHISTVDHSEIDSRLSEAEIILASDVDNPLLGPLGAARIYGPQKGADAEQIELLEAGLARWSQALLASGARDLADEPGAGAAGGVGFGALAVLGAHRRAGAELVLDLVDFDRQLAEATLVITGEGLLDEQTVHGKAPTAVAARSVAAGVPVIAVAGGCVLSAQRLRQAGFTATYALTDLEPDTERSIREAASLLTDLGQRLAHDWL